MSDSKLDVAKLEIAVAKDWYETSDGNILFAWAVVRGLDPGLQERIVQGLIQSGIGDNPNYWLVEDVSWGCPGNLGEVAAAKAAYATRMSDGSLLLADFGQAFPKEPTDEVIIAAVRTILSKAATFVPPVDEEAIAAIGKVIDQPTKHRPPED